MRLGQAAARYAIKFSAEKTVSGTVFQIDRPKGTVKHWKSTGTTWTYPTDYGYLPGHVGEDDEDLDVFVGDSPKGFYGSFLKLKRGPDGKMIPDETKFMVALNNKEKKKIFSFFDDTYRKDDKTYASMPEALQAMSKFRKLGRAAAEFAMNPRDLRTQHRGAPGKGDAFPGIATSTMSSGAMRSGGGFR